MSETKNYIITLTDEQFDLFVDLYKSRLGECTIKPQLTCQDCAKWHTTDCPHKESNLWLGEGYDDVPEWRYKFTEYDDFCKDGQPKEAK